MGTTDDDDDDKDSNRRQQRRRGWVDQSARPEPHSWVSVASDNYGWKSPLADGPGGEPGGRSYKFGALVNHGFMEMSNKPRQQILALEIRMVKVLKVATFLGGC